MENRDGFNSRLGFVLSAAGSAIGLGNIWGFPTAAANNGGGAFLMVYLIVIFLLALPALFAEMSIGHVAQANPVNAMGKACKGVSEKFGKGAGLVGLSGAIFMLSFYSIVAGWMLSNGLTSVADLMDNSELSTWLSTDSIARNFTFTPVFIILSAAIIIQGVGQGIEKWSKRLMPMLFVLLLGLIIYIGFQPGASEGFRTYLIPDFSTINPDLVINAMGQAFFSLSLGVGAMMVYGSYLKRGSQMGKLSISVALLDTSIAFLAGLLIIPAMFVAKEAGVNILNGEQLAGDFQLIFSILPALFDTMGEVGIFVGLVFFSLMSIAALTSTISSTEVPVAYLVENHSMGRPKATLLVSLVVLVFSSVIILNFAALFGVVVGWVMNWQLPLMGLVYFIVMGWMWKKGNLLLEIVEERPAMTWLSYYIKFVCPILMTIVFVSVAFH